MDSPTPAADVVGILLAGGQSSRMGGGDKCLAPIAGRPLLAHAIERLRPQVGRLVLNANGDAIRFAAFGLPVVADRDPAHKGPLAGILAGMEWARRHAPGSRFVATAATDTPFFPRDLVSGLRRAVGGKEVIAIARSAGRDHPVFGLFPTGLADDLADFIAGSPTLSVTAWIARHEWAAATFEPTGPEAPDPFFNINTPADLDAAAGPVAGDKLYKV